MTNEQSASGERVSPGAIVLDLLGDFRRSGGEELRLKTLVELGEGLGIPGPTMRVTLARFRERGWFDVRRDGRESVYRLSAKGLLTIHEGAQRIHRPAPEAWTGDWSMVIYTVPESDRQTRDELRKILAFRGFGPLAPATWIRPREQQGDVASATAGLAGARLTFLTTRTSGLAADRALAERCWELEPLGADYAEFVRQLHERMPAYRLAAQNAHDAFVARVQLVHEFRTFTRRDPQLPVDLQPAGWQGEEARRLFEQAHDLLSVNTAGYYGVTPDSSSVSSD